MSLIVTDNGPDWLQLRADRPRLRHLGIVDWRLPEQPVCLPRPTGGSISSRDLDRTRDVTSFNSAVPAANVLGER